MVLLHVPPFSQGSAEQDSVAQVNLSYYYFLLSLTKIKDLLETQVYLRPDPSSEFEKGGLEVHNQLGISGMISEKCYSLNKFSQKGGGMFEPH